MNLLKPLSALIKDIKLEAEGVKTYTLSMERPFILEPGQFNMIGHPVVGEAPISISSLVYNGCFDHTIKSVGRVTGFLDKLKSGEKVFLRGPYGKGWPVKRAEGKDILLIAGGVGLAPLRPVIQMILNQRGSFGEVSLIYGARNEKNLLFMNEFDIWKKEIALYLTVDEVTSKSPNPSDIKVIPPNSPLEKGGRGDLNEGHCGMVNKEGVKINVGLVTELLDRVKIKPERTVAFVCGPEIMMRFICRGLLMNGISHSGIYVSLERRMKCGIAQCGHCQHYGLFVCKDGPVFSYKEVRGLPDGML